MTVKELIHQLKKYPLDSEVGYIWDGRMRSAVTHVWLARRGMIAVSDGNVVYDTADRPEDAPTTSKNQYWEPK